MNLKTSMNDRQHPASQSSLVIFFLCALASLALCVESFAQSPMLIPFQGRLTNPQGVPYTNGQYSVIFNLYDQPVGGTVLWNETHQKVGVINGMINVFLGSINTLTNVDFSQARHLGITIDADGNPNTPDPEMVPRQMIIPAFWAKNSEKLAGYDWSAIMVGGNNPVTGYIPGSKIQATSISSNQIAAGSVSANNLSPGIFNALCPPGSITAFGGTNIPAGWLLCDGTAVSRLTYPQLFSAIGTAWGYGDNSTTFNLPDCTGLFLRGVDKTTNHDPDSGARAAMRSGANNFGVGSYQGDMYFSHTHNIYKGWSFIPNNQSGGSGYIYADCEAGFDHTGPTASSGGSETRPRNVYVNYIIKY